MSKDQINQSNVPSSYRKIVEDRDGESCRICGSVKNLQIHHIIPRILGRYHDYCNLMLLCGICHDAVESGKIPWNENQKEKLFHLVPVKAFIHNFEFEKIICSTHKISLSDEKLQPPIENYRYKNSQSVL